MEVFWFHSQRRAAVDGPEVTRTSARVPPGTVGTVRVSPDVAYDDDPVIFPRSLTSRAPPRETAGTSLACLNSVVFVNVPLLGFS